MHEGVDDPELEWKFCVAAIPAMLTLATVFHVAGWGQFLQRTFFTMPVHEFGHAVAAWLCGYSAIPTLWKTMVPDSRGFIVPVLLAGGLGWLVYRAWRAENRLVVALGGAVLLLAAIGTLGLREKTANMLIVFAGDALGMVLGTLLMMSFFFGKDTQLYKGSLRWGFVAIGAAAYVDMFGTWWAARKDKGRIPFGEMEGTGLTDATKLVDDHGWTVDQLVNRHVAVGVACLLALIAVYAWGVWTAKSKISE